MSISRITISVPEQIAANAQRAGRVGPGRQCVGILTALAEREPDWVQARAALDEMIEEAGGIPDVDRRWARSVFGLGEDDPT